MILIGSFYFIAVLFFVLCASFIVYHLAKYSLSKKDATLMIVFFLAIFIVLLLSNLTMFTALNWGEIISDFSFNF